MQRPYPRYGDIKNSQFFEDYLEKMYDWRDSVGLTEMIREMHSVIIEVDEADRHQYLVELAMMTPYQFKKSVENEFFIYTLLEISEKSPGYIVRSRKKPHQSNILSMNQLSPVALKKPYTRYIGEVYRVTDFDRVIDILTKAGVEFQNDGSVDHSDVHFKRTVPSQFTWNTVAYIQYPKGERRYYLDQFPEHAEPQDFLEKFRAAKAEQKRLNKDDLICPIDHLATRILHQDREHAILEYTKLTSYHYWGSYEITDQNSATNVTRNSHDFPEYQSPARVFTAANTPHYLDHIVKLPSPTESFVLNYGRRMHHIAYGLKDNAVGQKKDNIDIVVDNLKEQGIEFLLQVIGSAGEGLKQIFSRTSKYSLLITEYVQRYNGFQGFFTKKNVAFLTKAAGEDAELKKKEGRMGEKDISD